MYKSPKRVSRRTSVSDARQGFAEIVNRAAYGGDRVIVARHGRDIAAIVPMSDVRLLEELEAERPDRPRQAQPTPVNRRGRAPGA
jgi:prevent-host-death family protein